MTGEQDRERGAVSSPAADADPSPGLVARLAERLAAWLLRVTGQQHRHMLLPSKVTHPQSSFAATFGGTPPLVGSVVLLRCECGEGTGHLAEIQLRGRYTLEEIRGIPGWATDGTKITMGETAGA